MLIFGENKQSGMKILFLGILLIYAFILITRYAVPLLLKYFLKKLAIKFENQSKPWNNTNYNNVSADKEIKPKPTKKSTKDSPKVGEYIDFEEID